MAQILGRNNDTLEVTEEGRALVKAIIKREVDNAAINGDAWTFYFVNDDEAPYSNELSTANESGIAYIINNNERTMVLSAFIAYYGSPTAAGTGKLRFYKNPTAGTLIDSGTTVNAIIDNANFGSKASAASVNLEAKGGDGTALTVTTPAVGVPLPQRNSADGHAEVFDFVPVVLPQGTSIAFTYKPPASNTSMNVTFIVAAHFIDPNDEPGK